MIHRIGLYDSGVGGLSVAREVRRALPRADMIYVADTCHVPYGGRPFSDIKAFSAGIGAFLMSRGIDLLIIACNVSSAVACGDLRNRYPGVPVVSMIEHGARAALEGRSVGILATEGTVKSGAYPAALRAMGFGGEVVQEACPEFVPLVEGSLLDTPECREACERHCSRVSHTDTVILGCTHYPLMGRRLRDCLPGCRIADPAVSVAESLSREESRGSGSLTCYTTGDRDSFEQTAALFVPGISAASVVWRDGCLEEDD
ncbi:MAG: glutamate racemase [Abditibacteriota bacterium]|nr:glutamate racemase [Abditibacteriota bacterium]